jgi:hypothetical protein
MAMHNADTAAVENHPPRDVLPIAPIPIMIGAHNMLRPHNMVPPTLAFNAPSILPCMKCAQDVVIPQPGQRIPNIETIEQSGNPNCRCVPKP